MDAAFQSDSQIPICFPSHPKRDLEPRVGGGRRKRRRVKQDSLGGLQGSVGGMQVAGEPCMLNTCMQHVMAGWPFAAYMCWQESQVAKNIQLWWLDSHVHKKMC